MNAIKTVRKLPADRKTIEIMSEFLLLDHVMPELNHYRRTLPGIYDLFRLIETGGYGVFGAFDKDFRIVGISWGTMVDHETFEVHFAFMRGVDTLTACRFMRDEIKRHYGARYICGNIPECNRAAIILTRRLGFKDHGLTEYKHLTMAGKEYTCRKFVLEI